MKPAKIRGTWSVARSQDGQVCVINSHWRHETVLDISGDFASDRQVAAYAQAIADALNAASGAAPVAVAA